jgi:hypothetical protein
MADFTTEAEISITVPRRELRDARETIESEFEDISVGVDAAMGPRPGGGGGGGGVSNEEQQRRRRQIRLAQQRTDDIELIVEILENIEDDIGERGGGGDGFLDQLPRIGITGALGAGILGAGAIGSAVGGLSSALERVPSNINIEDIDPLPVEEVDPIPIKDIDPVPVADIDPLPIEEIDPLEIAEPDAAAEEAADSTTQGTTEGVPSSSISRIREGALAGTDTAAEESGVDVGDAAKKGVAGGIIGAIGSRLGELGRIFGGATRGPSPGGLPLPAPTIPIAEEVGERTDILPAPQRGARSSVQTLTPTETGTQPEIQLSVGDIQANVQADVQDAVDQAVEQLEQQRDQQIEDLRQTIERRVRELENGISRTTSTGVR